MLAAVVVAAVAYRMAAAETSINYYAICIVTPVWLLHGCGAVDDIGAIVAAVLAVGAGAAVGGQQ